ncbi:hypothetical protein HMPREF9984_02760, partial [Staphylococcus epidermidis NIHLM037]
NDDVFYFIEVFHVASPPFKESFDRLFYFPILLSKIQVEF